MSRRLGEESVVERSLGDGRVHQDELERLAVNSKECRVRLRTHRRRARRVVHQRQLAERVALGAREHHALGAVPRDEHLALAFEDDVEVVALGALRDDRRARLELAQEHRVEQRRHLPRVDISQTRRHGCGSSQAASRQDAPGRHQRS